MGSSNACLFALFVIVALCSMTFSSAKTLRVVQGAVDEVSLSSRHLQDASTCGLQDFQGECTKTRQCKKMYDGADDCSNRDGGVCLCGDDVCGCLIEEEEEEPEYETYYLVDAGTPEMDAGRYTGRRDRTYSTAASIASTGDYSDSIFQTHRFSNERLSYTFDNLEPKSMVNVTLGFAETYPPICAAGVGSRVMNVTVNERPFVSNLDVAEEVGCYTALFATQQNVKVNRNGILKIAITASVQKPFVSMIEIAA